MSGIEQSHIYTTLNFQLVAETTNQTTLIDKYNALVKNTQSITKEHFGGLLENVDLQDMHRAILELSDQVIP